MLNNVVWAIESLLGKNNEHNPVPQKPAQTNISQLLQARQQQAAANQQRSVNQDIADGAVQTPHPIVMADLNDLPTMRSDNSGYNNFGNGGMIDTYSNGLKYFDPTNGKAYSEGLFDVSDPSNYPTLQFDLSTLPKPRQRAVQLPQINR